MEVTGHTQAPLPGWERYQEVVIDREAQSATIRDGLEEIDWDLIGKGLDEIMRAQALIGSRVPGCIPGAIGTPAEVTGEMVSTYAFALCDEVHELAKELQWKSWKPRRPVDNKQTLGELADVIHLFAVMMIYVRATTKAGGHEIALRYHRKAEENLRRWDGNVEGYGV